MVTGGAGKTKHSACSPLYTSLPSLVVDIHTTRPNPYADHSDATRPPAPIRGDGEQRGTSAHLAEGERDPSTLPQKAEKVS
uniref:Uncharacterized protein n=1 Tax=uncultured marine virus TaxID=186617 RepID=A0A0F7L6J4_9VIRU|nr:hypothetical protein [uncultured marine virus]